ncbi:hypothetical protein BGX24_006836, partial [Mortierella sp. AD032]
MNDDTMRQAVNHRGDHNFGEIFYKDHVEFVGRLRTMGMRLADDDDEDSDDSDDGDYD